MNGPSPSGKCGWGGPGTWPCIGSTLALRRNPGTGPVYPRGHGRPPADRPHRGRVDTPLPRRPQAPGRDAQHRRRRPRRHGLRPSRRVRLGHRDAAHGRARRRSGAPSTGSTSRPCAPPPGRASSPGATITPSGWASWLTSPSAFPGYTARLPKTAATLPRLLRDAGYSTLAVGKWHLTPRWQRSAAGPFDLWPLGLGFERYYGFLQGDTNHWAPNLVCDNHYVDPPRRPEEGYHLTEDLADQAVRMVQDQQQAAPGKPFFLYFALGAMHAPHHVTRNGSSPIGAPSTRAGTPGATSCSPARSATGVVPEGTDAHARPQWVGPGPTTRPTSGACSPVNRRSSPASSRTPTSRSAACCRPSTAWG